MKKYLSLLLLFLLFADAKGQLVDTFFINIPDQLLPYVAKNTREDLIDFWNAKQTSNVVNALGDKVVIINKTQQYLKLKTSEASYIELKVVRGQDSSIVVLVNHTVCGPACDSKIEMYNDCWEQQPPMAALSPSVRDFLRPDLNLKDKKIGALINGYDLCLAKAELSPDKPEVCFTLQLTDYYEKEREQEIKSLFLDSIVVSLESPVKKRSKGLRSSLRRSK